MYLLSSLSRVTYRNLQLKFLEHMLANVYKSAFCIVKTSKKFVKVVKLEMWRRWVAHFHFHFDLPLQLQVCQMNLKHFSQLNFTHRKHTIVNVFTNLYDYFFTSNVFPSKYLSIAVFAFRQNWRKLPPCSWTMFLQAARSLEPEFRRKTNIAISNSIILAVCHSR